MNLVFSDKSLEEIEKIKKDTGLETSEILQYGFSLFRMYVNAQKEGKEFRIIDPKNLKEQAKIDLVWRKNA
ncbi:MAG: hypothetical protein EKK64_01800 [Neisseriaceae bacterium]|nr:MAG: hypothetical protein EKK64_01800 [Neisseriaceae bacterium]